MSNPGFDICSIFHVVVVDQDIGVPDKNVDYRRVFEILSQTAYCNTISAVAGDLDSVSREGEIGVWRMKTFWTKML